MVGADSGRGKRKDLRCATSAVLRRHIRQEMRQIQQQIILLQTMQASQGKTFHEGVANLLACLSVTRWPRDLPGLCHDPKPPFLSKTRAVAKRLTWRYRILKDD
jgi:hypothetical protein